jgi:hypothetical protein
MFDLGNKGSQGSTGCCHTRHVWCSWAFTVMLREGEVEEPFKLMQREKAVVPEASSSIYAMRSKI